MLFRSVVKTTGDGILIEFPSIVEAVACAVAVQHGMAERNAAKPEGQRIEFRVGVNLGDVIVEDGDIHGDGVNVAARLEALTEPGGVCVSGTVRDHIGDRLDLTFDDLGDQSLKNIARPIRVFRVRVAIAGTTAPLVKPTPTFALPDKPSIAVLPFINMSNDPEQEFFADGIAEDIITPLLNREVCSCRSKLNVYLQRPRRRCQIGWPQVGRALRTRRQRSQIR